MKHATLIVSALVLAAFVAFAGPATAGDVTVEDARARATIGSSGTSAVFFTIRNGSDAADRLLAVETEVAGAAEMHATSSEGGIMKMRRLDHVDIAPGAAAEFAPGGHHVMLIGVTQKLEPGDSVPLVLKFEKAGEIAVAAPVVSLAEAMDAHAGHGHSGDHSHGSHGSGHSHGD